MGRPRWRPSDVPLCRSCRKREAQEKKAYNVGDMGAYLQMAGTITTCATPGCKQTCGG